MTKVLFLINSLGGGGAERVLINLVNNMDFSRYDVTVQTIFPAGVNKQFLSSRVRLLEGKSPCFHGVSAVFKVLPAWILAKLIKPLKSDVYIAYMHGAPTKIIWGLKGPKKSIAWLHSDMRTSSLPKFLTHKQAITCFKSYDRIVGVSESVADSFKEVYGISDKLTVAYNTNDTKKILSSAQEVICDCDQWCNYDGIRLITVGRLGPEKGYDRLLNVCHRLKEDGKEFKILIVGKGSEENFLREYIHEYKLEDTVFLTGFRPNPYPYMKRAELFVSSSRIEGLSTVVSESLILDTPVLSTNVSGAREVLGDSEYGVVVNNSEDALYDGLKDLLSHPEKIQYYTCKARERAPFFETSVTVKAVEDLIDEVVGCQN